MTLKRFKHHNTRKPESVLITGASSGIGKQYALAIAHRYKPNLVLTARRKDRLCELKTAIEKQYALDGVSNRQILVLPADISNHNDLTKLIAEIDQHLPNLDLLINNAGFGYLGSVENSNVANQLQMVAVNCSAPLRLIHHWYPKMINRGYGGIINVCSICSFQPMPYMATYGATKAFLYSLTMAIAREGRKHNLHFMAHCPGPTSSEFHIAAGLPEKLDYVPGMSAELVVAQALDAFEKGEQLIINGRLNYFLSYLSTFLPTWLSTKIVCLILRKHR